MTDDGLKAWAAGQFQDIQRRQAESAQNMAFGHGMDNITGRSPFASSDRAHIQPTIPCLGWVGHIFGHRFEQFVTYNEAPPSGEFSSQEIAVIALGKPIVYRTVHTSAIRCVRCGVEGK